MTLTRKRFVAILVAFVMVIAAAAIISIDYSYAETKKPGQVKELKYAKVKDDPNAAKLTWKKVKNAKKYEIQSGYDDYDENGKEIIVWETEKKVTKTSYKACQGQLYKVYYRVRAINGSKKGKWSKKISVKLPVKKYKGTIVPNFGGLFAWPANLISSGSEDGYTCYYYNCDLGSNYARLYAEDYSAYLQNEAGWSIDEREGCHIKDGVKLFVQIRTQSDGTGQAVVLFK